MTTRWQAAAHRVDGTAARGYSRRPANGHRAVLAALSRRSPQYVSELARNAAQTQGNVTVYLRRLERYGFVIMTEQVPGMGRQGGGRPAKYWQLTRAGQLLVQEVEPA